MQIGEPVVHIVPQLLEQLRPRTPPEKLGIHLMVRPPQDRNVLVPELLQISGHLVYLCRPLVIQFRAWCDDVCHLSQRHISSNAFPAGGCRIHRPRLVVSQRYHRSALTFKDCLVNHDLAQFAEVSAGVVSKIRTPQSRIVTGQLRSDVIPLRRLFVIVMLSRINSISYRRI
ncbi:hypothetical protein D3C75_633910 [compost metagenome]